MLQQRFLNGSLKYRTLQISSVYRDSLSSSLFFLYVLNIKFGTKYVSNIGFNV
jgi:hypothetical protein